MTVALKTFLILSCLSSVNDDRQYLYSSKTHRLFRMAPNTALFFYAILFFF